MDASRLPRQRKPNHVYHNLRNHFAQIIYWTLYTKIGIYNLERKDRWHDHEPKTVLKNDEAKIL